MNSTNNTHPWYQEQNAEKRFYERNWTGREPNDVTAPHLLGPSWLCFLFRVLAIILCARSYKWPFNCGQPSGIKLLQTFWRCPAYVYRLSLFTCSFYTFIVCELWIVEEVSTQKYCKLDLWELGCLFGGEAENTCGQWPLSKFKSTSEEEQTLLAVGEAWGMAVKEVALPVGWLAWIWPSLGM